MATGAHEEAGGAAEMPTETVIHLPLAPGAHNVSIEAPGALPASRIVEIPRDGSGARLHIRLEEDPEQPADHGQHAEERAGESMGLPPAGRLPYAILRGRGAGDRHAGGEARAMPPELQMGAGVHAALAGNENAGVATGGNGADDAASAAGGAAGGQEVAIGGQAADEDAAAGRADTEEPVALTGGTAAPGGGMTAALAGKMSEMDQNSFQTRVHATVAAKLAAGQGAASQEAEVDHTAEVGGAGAGAGDGAAAVVVVAVAAEKPHSRWWRVLRGGIAAAGAVFVAVQVMRLHGRPAVPLAGGDGVWRGGSRAVRGDGQVITHGHHSFHHRTPGGV